MSYNVPKLSDEPKELRKILDLELKKIATLLNKTATVKQDTQRSFGGSTIIISPSNKTRRVRQSVTAGTNTITFKDVGTIDYSIGGTVVQNETTKEVSMPLILESTKSTSSFQIESEISGIFQSVLSWD